MRETLDDPPSYHSQSKPFVLQLTAPALDARGTWTSSRAAHRSLPSTWFLFTIGTSRCPPA
eukprot:1237104-Heterocapsa_arctica.AAC.1